MLRRILLVGQPGADRPALEALLRREAYEIIGATADPADAAEAAGRLQPDFVVVGLEAAEEDVPELLRGVSKAWPATLLIGVGPGTSRQDIEAAFRAGLRGYVVTARTANDLVRALREVGHGEVFLSPLASRALVEPYL